MWSIGDIENFSNIRSNIEISEQSDKLGVAAYALWVTCRMTLYPIQPVQYDGPQHTNIVLDQ